MSSYFYEAESFIIEYCCFLYIKFLSEKSWVYSLKYNSKKTEDDLTPWNGNSELI